MAMAHLPLRSYVALLLVVGCLADRVSITEDSISLSAQHTDSPLQPGIAIRIVGFPKAPNKKENEDERLYDEKYGTVIKNFELNGKTGIAVEKADETDSWVVEVDEEGRHNIPETNLAVRGTVLFFTAGGFKPPHRGHYQLVKEGMETALSETSDVHPRVSLRIHPTDRPRNGYTDVVSERVWKAYLGAMHRTFNVEKVTEFSASVSPATGNTVDPSGWFAKKAASLARYMSTTNDLRQQIISERPEKVVILVGDDRVDSANGWVKKTRNAEGCQGSQFEVKVLPRGDGIKCGTPPKPCSATDFRNAAALPDCSDHDKRLKYVETLKDYLPEDLNSGEQLDVARAVIEVKSGSSPRTSQCHYADFQKFPDESP